MLDRSSPPSFLKEFSFKLPAPDIIEINDHLDFVLLKNLEQNVFKLEVVFASGKWFEPKPGVSYFTAEMLDKGTKTKTSLEIAKTLEYYGAQIEISSGVDFLSASVYGLKKFLKETVNIFYEIITDPIFAEDELASLKKIYIQNLRVNKEKNSYVASQLIRKNIFGSTHPYGNSIEESDVLNLTSVDLVNYFTAHFFLQEIYFIGNLAPQEVLWLTNEFKAYKNLPNLNQNHQITKGVPSEHIQKEGSLQTSIRMGKQIVNRDHKDFPSVLLANHILGGFFGSRLMKNIREDKGMTYGIYSSINPFKKDALLTIATDVNNQNLDLAVMEIKSEIKILQNELMGTNELTLAKNHFLGSLVSEVSNPFLCLAKFKTQRLNSLPKNYYEVLFNSINACNAEQVQYSSQQYFATDELSLVSVG
ncbi:MAG TPA: hypothetical protein DGG95_14210 [Cytophagales bacterium]|nr:hypothetical protein [Cytophagales bacterium]